MLQWPLLVIVFSVEETRTAVAGLPKKDNSGGITQHVRLHPGEYRELTCWFGTIDWPTFLRSGGRVASHSITMVWVLGNMQYKLTNSLLFNVE